MIRTLESCGFEPRYTPVDILMGAPLGVGLAVAEAMEDDGDYADDDLAEGFQEADLYEEVMDEFRAGAGLY